MFLTVFHYSCWEFKAISFSCFLSVSFCVVFPTMGLLLLSCMLKLIKFVSLFARQKLAVSYRSCSGVLFCARWLISAICCCSEISSWVTALPQGLSRCSQFWELHINLDTKLCVLAVVKVIWRSFHTLEQDMGSNSELHLWHGTKSILFCTNGVTFKLWIEPFSVPAVLIFCGLFW